MKAVVLFSSEESGDQCMLLAIRYGELHVHHSCTDTQHILSTEMIYLAMQSYPYVQAETSISQVSRKTISVAESPVYTEVVSCVKVRDAWRNDKIQNAIYVTL
jgi:hypothetical protein